MVPIDSTHDGAGFFSKVDSLYIYIFFSFPNELDIRALDYSEMALLNILSNHQRYGRLFGQGGDWKKSNQEKKKERKKM